MITERRRQVILDQLNQKKIVTIHDLTTLTGASESTVRRDLCDLEKQKLLLRIHGGAKLVTSSLLEESKVGIRAQLHQSVKKLIAQRAVNLINDHEVIFLDSGTTTRAMIPFLANHQDLLVLTNSVDNAALLADYQINTIMLGGQLRNSTKAAVGQTVLTYLRDCHLDQAFLGTNGFDESHGFTTPDPEESLVKRIAIEQSEQAYILTDHSKYQQTRFSKFASIQNAAIISDELPADIKARLMKHTILMEVTK
ncbi:DeoR/GlpR family DNA-binding transcription regulator [Bombilactobacillus folatiphilus]|uniref:DeoR/GlpR family DNA-binding transcription regulator n=1 Tax=Bombilactobacillus folatiphilus TaxID=2923362 RepID=A0ABY4PAM2_9LACO|nr:DeoR/GlpR family DNA-binding transcription regulator [Bombilactobacillus folatiphilus]UQS82759.1 DeoR/GlpR family DNA-binding transcription regulator [Bombilactobacillus folatiphilus]